MAYFNMVDFTDFFTDYSLKNGELADEIKINTPTLRLKKEVMRQFILTRFYDLPENADVMEAFNQFEKEQMQADMEEFAFDNQIDFKIVSDLVSAYTFSGNVSEDNIRERLMAYPLGLLKMTKLTKNVKRFIQDTYKKYKAEGETE